MRHTEGALRFSEDENDRPLLGFVSRAYAAKWADVLRRDPCSYCGQRGLDMTVDHIHPYSRRSQHKLSRTQHLSRNGTGACSRCNEVKTDRDLLRYLCEHPIGRRPDEPFTICWPNGPTTPQKLFSKIGVDTPSRNWWQHLFAQLSVNEPVAHVQHERAGVWQVALEFAGRQRVLEIKADVQPKSIIVHRVKWR